MQEEELAQTPDVFSKQETNVWAPLLSLSRDKGQTNTPGPSLQIQALPGHTTPAGSRALCCCSPATPGAQDGKELQAGWMYSARRGCSTDSALCWVGIHPFLTTGADKFIQALQALHSTPCGQMFSCCVLCVCTGEPEAFESSQLCSQLPPHPGSGQALSLHSSCFLQGGKHMEDKPQGRRGQVGAELLRSCPWAKLLSLVSFRWALHRVHRISTAR